MSIFDHTMQLLERAMDVRGARQRVIASNIANEETPGYRAKDVDFRQAMSTATGRPPVTLAATHRGHIGGVANGASRVAQVTEVPAQDLPLDANSVNLDLEMAKLSENAMHYNTEATVVAMRLRQVLSAIRDAR